jgi:hypothetical protein
VTRVFWGDEQDWYDRLSVGLSGRMVYDYEGKLTDGQADILALYQGPLQSLAVAQISRKREHYAGKDYDLSEAVAMLEMKPFGGMRFGLHALYGDAIDYSNARPADQLLLAPILEFNLGRHFNVNLQHTLQSLSDGGGRVFTANLSQGRFIYNFNVKTFVRLIVQYMDVDRNPDVYGFPVLPKTRTLFTQFLFSYKFNPQTVVFLGYSDNSMGDADIALTQLDRTFFVKLGYAWTR